jgi:hypothetical protein
MKYAVLPVYRNADEGEWASTMPRYGVGVGSRCLINDEDEDDDGDTGGKDDNKDYNAFDCWR